MNMHSSDIDLECSYTSEKVATYAYHIMRNVKRLFIGVAFKATGSGQP